MKLTVSGGKVDGPISAADSQSLHIDKVILHIYGGCHVINDLSSRKFEEV